MKARHVTVAACFVGFLATCGAFAAGCSASTKEGVTIDVALAPPSSPALSEEKARTFQTALGVRVVVTRGYLSTGSVEVFGCASAATWLKSLVLPEAHAHTEGSPTLLGISAVESLLAPSNAVGTAVGTLHPPAGAYCRVKQTIQAADDDAVELPEDVPEVLGKSVYVTGTVALGGASPRPFTLSSTLAFDVESTFPAVSLSAGGIRLVRVLLTKAGEHWFDTVDFSDNSDDAARGQKLLEGIRASLGARIE